MPVPSRPSCSIFFLFLEAGRAANFYFHGREKKLTASGASFRGGISARTVSRPTITGAIPFPQPSRRLPVAGRVHDEPYHRHNRHRRYQTVSPRGRYRRRETYTIDRPEARSSPSFLLTRHSTPRTHRLFSFLPPRSWTASPLFPFFFFSDG